MLESIRLTNFGKYTNEEFALKPCSLFLGPNEAGKTTVFDAICKAVCKNKLWGMERYGEAASCEASFSQPPPERVEASEFYEFFAIRGEDLSLPLASGQGVQWRDKVRNSLFSGGINPEVLAQDLDKQLNSRQRRETEKRTRGELAELDSSLADWRSEIERAVSSRRDLSRLEADRDGARENLAKIERERLECSQAQTQRLQAKRLGECRAILADLQVISDLRSRRPFKDERAQLEAIKSALNEEAVSEAKAQMESQAHTRLHEHSQARRAQFEEASRAKLAAASLAKEMLSDLSREAIAITTRRRIFGKASIIACSSFLILALASLGIGFTGLLPSPLTIIMTLASVTAGGLLAIALRDTRQEVDESPVEAALERQRARWNLQRGVLGEFPRLGLEGSMAFLAQVITEAEKANALLSESREEELRLGAEAQSLRNAHNAMYENLRRSRQEYQDWLNLRLCSSEADYIQALKLEAEASQREIAVTQRLAREWRGLGLAGEAELKAQILRELSQLESRLSQIGEAKYADVVFSESEQAERLERLDQEYRQRESEYRKREEAYAQAKLSSGLSLGQSQAKLAGGEARRQELARQIGEQDAQRRAEEACAYLFRKMAEKGTSALDGLAARINELFSRGGGPSGDLELRTLDLDRCLVRDAGGHERSPAHLSRGTRDLFILACRLALAEAQARSPQKPRLLLFDEAFRHMDQERLAQALAMIGEFASDSWQVIFFSKDFSLSEGVQRAFPKEGLIVYDLSKDKEHQ